MTQHAGLTPERWSAFQLDQQILMISNEMHRAQSLLEPEDRDRLRGAYERVLRLVDLTVEVQCRASLRKELLRFREVVAELYLREAVEREEHRRALRALLLMTPAAAAQIPFVLE